MALWGVFNLFIFFAPDLLFDSSSAHGRRLCAPAPAEGFAEGSDLNVICRRFLGELKNV